MADDWGGGGGDWGGGGADAGRRQPTQVIDETSPQDAERLRQIFLYGRQGASQQNIAGMNNQSAENIAAGRNQTALELSRGGPSLNMQALPAAGAPWQTQAANQQRLADTAVSPALQANQMRQARFDQLFPWLQGQMSGLQSTFGNSAGSVGLGPNITVGGVWNPQQIQQQVNATRAQNDQSLASQNRGQQQTTAGQGFGSHSPILAALQGQNAAANLATNTQAEQQLRTTTAQQNQQATLASQQAKQSQYNQQQQQITERGKTYAQTYSALLSALGGLA